ncbi:MAG: hypothetical protein WC867_01895 [Candidatus Pacearchaeota archaeon]|jgi:DNA mismatch repair ATPase MutS
MGENKEKKEDFSKILISEKSEIKKEIIIHIKENKLSPFNQYKTSVKQKNESIYKTNDGKSIHNKVINRISSNFIFPDTSNLLNCFYFTDSVSEIIKRQDFFKEIEKNIDNNLLDFLKKPRIVWKPKYGIVVVTDDEDTFSKLKNLDVPVKYLLNEDDVRDLENYDIVQVVEVENFNSFLEQLPQTVFLDSIEDVYLERYLEILSGWKDNFKILENVNDYEIKNIIEELAPLLSLISIEKIEKLSRKIVEETLENINEEVSIKIKEMNIAGSVIFEMLSKGKLPEELEQIITKTIKETNIPEHLFNISIPVKIDEKELENYLKIQDANENTGFAERIKKNSSILKKVPEKLNKLSELLLIYDFLGGITKFNKESNHYPEYSEEFKIEDAKNIFLDKAQPISFHLHDSERCSILTGANSGGKTTLIEHIIQIISLFNMGFPLNGKVKIPIFSEIYYFAKNKGSASKGAFETLLTQMSKIIPGRHTLILADEIEAVTEPGVAGKIIAATSSYFIDKNCFLVIATHLGYEIEKVLPLFSRIDGIEAKGLDENNELIVDHNPVLGRLANSTPELIVEKMANSGEHEYFNFLHKYLQDNDKSLKSE